MYFSQYEKKLICRYVCLNTGILFITSTLDAYTLCREQLRWDLFIDVDFIIIAVNIQKQVCKRYSVERSREKYYINKQQTSDNVTQP